MISKQEIARIKENVSCQDIAERYGLKRVSGTKGGWQLYHRPGEIEKKPSFGIKPNGWRDFATNKRGNVLDLVMMLEGCDFITAFKISGGETETHPLQWVTRPIVSLTKQISATWQKSASEALDIAKTYLWSNRTDAQLVREYLREVRGLTDDTIKANQLGYLPNWTKTSYSKEDGSFASVAPGIVIPTFDQGKLQALKIRTRSGNLAKQLKIPEDHWGKSGESFEAPKYTQMAGGNPSPLFGIDAIRADRAVVIVEGEFDAILGNQQANDLAVFVTVGSASNTLNKTDVQALRKAPRIIVMTDNDLAGHESAKRIMDQLPTAQRAILPIGKDLTDFVTLHKEDLARWLMAFLAMPIPFVAASLPDSIRSAGLHCKLAPAIVAYEVCKAANLSEPFTKKEVYEASQRFNTGISQSMIYRGVNQGVFIIPFSKTILDCELDSYKDTRIVFENETKNGMADGQLFTLASLDQIVAGLHHRLHYRLIERLFPAQKSLLPPIEADLIKALGHEDPARIAEQVQTLVNRLTDSQEKAKSQAKARYEKRILDQLLSKLNQPTVTRIHWAHGVDFAVQLYRTIHQADPRNRSENEIALITGYNPKHIDGLLERAGIKSTQRADLLIQVSDPEALPSSLEALAKAAKGQGKIDTIRAYNQTGDYEETEFTNFSEARLWAAAGLEQGQRVEFSIRMKNEQKIVSDLKPRRSRATHPVKVQPLSESLVPTSNQLQRADPRPIYTGEGYDPDYARATLIKIYARDRQVSVDEVACETLSNLELIELILFKVKVIISPDPDQCPQCGAIGINRQPNSQISYSCPACDHVFIALPTLPF